MTLFGNLFKRQTLFFPGCLNKFVLNELANNYLKILNKINMNYVVLKDEEVCCGGPAKTCGYKKVFTDLCTKNTELFKKNKIGKIITPDPGCYHYFKNYYTDFQVEHISEVLLRYLEFLPLKNEKITYFEPCYMENKNATADETKNLLTAMGYEVVEIKEKMCCGAGGGLKSNLPLVANKMARAVLNQVKTPKLITSCGMCYLHLKANASDLEVLELSQVLL